ncbi:MAG: prolyl-tRNA synthetase associated domain-containing protein [Pseudomonadota bacterium]
MSLSSDTLIESLRSGGYEFELFNHPAVFSTADIVNLPEPIPGADTKNLFLRDEKRTRYVLVCVRAEKRVDLKALGKALGIKGITFASPEEMMTLLGVTPGSVCLFALANDQQGRVGAYLDASIVAGELMQNHPLINTATVVLEVSQIERFCDSVGHKLERLEVPVRVAVD